MISLDQSSPDGGYDSLVVRVGPYRDVDASSVSSSCDLHIDETSADVAQDDGGGTRIIPNTGIRVAAWKVDTSFELFDWMAW